MKNVKWLVIMMISFAVCMGCSNIKSQNVDTNNMVIVFALESNEEGTVVIASLATKEEGSDDEWVIGEEAGPLFIELSGGDKLTAYVNGSEIGQDFIKKDLGHPLLNMLFNVFYTASFTENSNDEFRIAFIRPNHEDASNSMITLPPFVNITTPSPGDEFEQGDTIAVAWNAIEWDGIGEMPEVSLNFARNCTKLDGSEGSSDSEYRKVPDNGYYEIDAIELYDRMDTEDNNCSVTIELTRLSTGEVDSAFMNGSINAKQILSLDVGLIVP